PMSKGLNPGLSDIFPETKTKKQDALEKLFLKAIEEKPELSKANLRRFVRRDYPFLSKTSTEDYAEGLLVLIERYLEKKKFEKSVGVGVSDDKSLPEVSKES